MRWRIERFCSHDSLFASSHSESCNYSLCAAPKKIYDSTVFIIVHIYYIGHTYYMEHPYHIAQFSYYMAHSSYYKVYPYYTGILINACMLWKKKNARNLSWMFHGIMCFWFLLIFFFSFRLPLIFYLRYQFPAFFRPMKILINRHSQNNYQIWLLKLNSVCVTLLSIFQYFSCQSSKLLLLSEVCENHERGNTSVGGGDQHRDALFQFM